MKNVKFAAGLLLGTWLLAACGTETGPSAGDGLQVVEYQAPAQQPEALAAFVRREVPTPKTAVVYFYADWCGPCRRFKAALHEAPVEAALRHATIIKVNVDKYPELAAFFAVEAIPAFFKLDEKGAVAAHISSDKWGEDTPEQIAPVMNRFVNTTAYDAR